MSDRHHPNLDHQGLFCALTYAAWPLAGRKLTVVALFLFMGTLTAKHGRQS